MGFCSLSAGEPEINMMMMMMIFSKKIPSDSAEIV